MLVFAPGHETFASIAIVSLNSVATCSWAAAPPVTGSGAWTAIETVCEQLSASASLFCSCLRALLMSRKVAFGRLAIKSCRRRPYSPSGALGGATDT